MAPPRKIDPTGKAPGKPYTVRMAADTIRRLEREAARRGITVSEVIRERLADTGRQGAA